MLFQLNWNTGPTYLEQESNLAVTKWEFKKLTTRTCRVGNEMWRLGVGRMNGLAMIGRGMNRLDGAKLLPNAT